MLGNLEDSVHCSGPSDPEGSGQGCGEKLPLWMRLPLAWSVPARGGTQVNVTPQHNAILPKFNIILWIAVLVLCC